MDPIQPITPPAAENPAPAFPPTAEPHRLDGVRRSMAMLGLAVGLLAVGGAAAVMAASPEPSTGTTPSAIETPSTQPSATEDDSSRTSGRHDRGDCPVDAGGTPGGSGSDPDDGGTSPSTAPSTPPSTAPSTDPSAVPEV